MVDLKVLSAELAVNSSRCIKLISLSINTSRFTDRQLCYFLRQKLAVLPNSFRSKLDVYKNRVTTLRLMQGTMIVSQS
jgi:hypothetical protein